MAIRYVSQTGTQVPPYSSPGTGANTVATACTNAQAGDEIRITGEWTAPDTANVTANVALTITAEGASKHPGYPNRTSPTHYRHEVATGHAFVTSANLTMSDVDVRSSSGGTSDELCRATGGTAFEFNNCLLGFDIAIGSSQQDGFYSEVDLGPVTVTFNQCVFYSIGRSAVDIYNAETGWTINLNSCQAYNCGYHGGRNNGIVIGTQHASVQTLVINAQNCLFHLNPTQTNRVVFASSSNSNSTVNCDNFIMSDDATKLTYQIDTENVSNPNYNHTWTVNQSPGAGDWVIVRDLTTPYDLRLFDNETDNDAQTQHSTETGLNSELAIPANDIVGTARAAPYDIGPFRVTAAAPGPGGAMPVIMQQYLRHLN